MHNTARGPVACQVDLLVFYTAEVLAYYGTTSFMESGIAAGYATSQEAMANSDISMTLNVVHMEQVIIRYFDWLHFFLANIW